MSINVHDESNNESVLNELKNAERQRKVFANNLRHYVGDNSQKQIADKLGVSTQTFNTWYKGKAIPRMGTIQKIASLFNVSISDLINPKTSDSDPQAVECEKVKQAYLKADDVTKEMVKRILNIKDE